MIHFATRADAVAPCGKRASEGMLDSWSVDIHEVDCPSCLSFAGWRLARGVLPWTEGEPLPEEQIRRVRDRADGDIAPCLVCGAKSEDRQYPLDSASAARLEAAISAAIAGRGSDFRSIVLRRIYDDLWLDTPDRLQESVLLAIRILLDADRDRLPFEPALPDLRGDVSRPDPPDYDPDEDTGSGAYVEGFNAGWRAGYAFLSSGRRQGSPQ